MISCDSALENNGISAIFTDPQEAGATILCTGSYTLTASDVNDLKRESSISVEARDQYNFAVGTSVSETVFLKQVIQYIVVLDSLRATS